MEFRFDVQIKIQKPVADVFNAVYHPKHLSAYFTTAGASAPMDEGTTVQWEFADFPGAFPVDIKRTVKNEVIEFEWDASDGAPDLSDPNRTAPDTLPYKTRVKFQFKPLGPNETHVLISEGVWRENEKGLKASYGNCMGWSQMAVMMKAYLEHGINLRKGAY